MADPRAVAKAFKAQFKIAPRPARLFFIAQSGQKGIVAQNVPNEQKRSVDFTGGIFAIRPGKISFRFQIVAILECHLAGVGKPLALPGVSEVIER